MDIRISDETKEGQSGVIPKKTGNTINKIKD